VQAIYGLSRISIPRILTGAKRKANLVTIARKRRKRQYKTSKGKREEREGRKYATIRLF
jgi:hypothetical protein